MEELIKEQHKLASKSSYKTSISEVDRLISQLSAARDAISETPSVSAAQLVTLNQSVKKSFDGMQSNLREVNSGLKSYARVLDKVCSVYLATFKLTRH
jgi:hypothetical protein